MVDEIATVTESDGEEVVDSTPREELGPVKLQRTKSWKEYDDKDEIAYILAEGFLPVKFQADETVRS